ncbi:MAG: pyruvate:ferredoxin (flavodoxin) oxidoreductase [Christensenellaceae bacterium]|jgi:pyruvate-ferredoxin/flavodoxin oxidoreductase|nr:pyruvate:ferredoxin (flavodoxin) oxidoreductase [Christensenellaceae bacterium]
MKITISGNQAAAMGAYPFIEAAAIYPITPSSDMAEYTDEWASKGQKNALGTVPRVIEMQSEAGAAGTLHGLLSAGALATTYTASQGLLLMIPNMYKIVGELLPCVIHVSARTIATHALSIFGDHSDVYAARQTGFAMLASSSVQEAYDMSAIAHAAAINASYPVLQFMDGFRTSHEFNKVETLENDKLFSLVDKNALNSFRSRALNPKNPVMHGSSQNSDTYFQNREAQNKIIEALPRIFENEFKKFAELSGRKYSAFEYFGSPTATNIVVCMGSGCETIKEYIELSGDKNIGVIKVRLYRPFDTVAFLKTLPKTAKVITVLDRTKENGSAGEPLYGDVCTALAENGIAVKVLSGRYGLSSKEFTPAMCGSIFANAVSAQKNHFTVGINDDVSFSSLEVKPIEFKTAGLTECVFYGLGSDGTVGANKNSVAIIGDGAGFSAQSYFVYDSKKSGGTTISHLRFSKNPIEKPYLIERPDFVAIHNQTFLNKFDMTKNLKKGGTILLNTTYSVDELCEVLPTAIKRQVFSGDAHLYIINAYEIAKKIGLNTRINTIMQSAFFKLANLMDYAEVKTLMKKAIDKSYGKKGQAVLDMNYAAVDSADKYLVKIDGKLFANCLAEKVEKVKALSKTEAFVATINALNGDDLPVSAFPADGTFPTGTTALEKRDIATSMPKWIPENCIGCNRCALVCPHACIRPALIDKDVARPESFKTCPALGINGKDLRLQLSPRDCTGCGSCANVCPAREKALVMTPYNEIDEDANYEFSLKIENPKFEPTNVKMSQFAKPYFEFSGACAGCGETPYLKLLTQLYGDNLIIANATGCSSIYGGSSPSCPYSKDKNGRGPAWANSLFEDNAEFGLGIKLGREINGADNAVWVVGGDGWAYDIGFGGLDHLLSRNDNINILVLDTEVYSNTGGQASKATPISAVAKFAANGKHTFKKDLGAIAMTYPNVYVAQVVMGANYEHTLKCFKEAAAHNGPSLIIAQATCINHGIDMSNGMKILKDAVDCGYFKLYHRSPAENNGEVILDSPPPTGDINAFLSSQTRFKSLEKTNPTESQALKEKLVKSRNKN